MLGFSSLGVIDAELRSRLAAALNTIWPYTVEALGKMVYEGTVPDYPVDEAWDAVHKANEAIGARLASSPFLGAAKRNDERWSSGLWGRLRGRSSPVEA